MTQIARSTCVKCHKILPRTEMTQVKKRVKSGDSIGASGSLFGNKKGQRNIRISSRDYYRNKLVWMCHECADSESFFGSISFFSKKSNKSINKHSINNSNEDFNKDDILKENAGQRISESGRSFKVNEFLWWLGFFFIMFIYSLIFESLAR